MTAFHPLSRRELFRLAAAGFAAYSSSGWLGRLAEAAANNPQRKRSCILLWMAGGPSQMDTFDLKPGHENGGPFKEIQSAVPGIKISEHLPRVAKQMKDLAIIRSMSTRESDHGRATYLLRTGRVPGGPIQYPPLGSLVAKELAAPEAELPSFVSIAPFRFLSPAAFEAGFLGPQYAPLVIGDGAANFGPAQPGDADQALKVKDLDLPSDVGAKRAAGRLQMLDEMQQEFLAERSGLPSESHRTAYQRAVTLMRSKAVKAFDLSEESKELRDKYGRNLFGQGCLLARRLVEREVPFVEVTLSSVPGQGAIGWDTHQDNFNGVRRLSEVLDPAWATLMEDLRTRGLLETTLIVWMGEFGRTPKIVKDRTGRDHWSASWSAVLGGGGIKGGQVVGKTSADGTKVEERLVPETDFLATIGRALGIDVQKQNQSNVGRPIRIVEPTAKPIKEVLA
jgi:hypothetical protein